MAKQVIAFDIGGTSIRASIVENNKIIEHEKIPTPKNKKLFLSEIEKLIEKLNSKKIYGIGIGIAGLIKDGKIGNAPNLALKNFDLKKHLKNKYKKKVEIANDAECFALAEAKLGIKKDNFILLTFGTGIGGGIIIDGKIYNGQGYGAEFGHMNFSGKHFEGLWQNTRKEIRKEYKENKLFKELIKMKSPKSKKILKEASNYIGQGISSLISAFDPEVVVIGGGIREADGPLLKLIKDAVRKHSFLKKNTPIVWTKLKHPGTLGASLLISKK
ncbi:ROK family protein [Candidatus Pacearchaeota archaeon]|nr:ROK family protein [Candidatus Pacearchaeota archaeon]